MKKSQKPADAPSGAPPSPQGGSEYRFHTTATITPATRPELAWEALGKASRLLAAGELDEAFDILEESVEPRLGFESMAALFDAPPPGKGYVADELMERLGGYRSTGHRARWASLVAGVIFDVVDRFDKALETTEPLTAPSKKHAWMRFVRGRTLLRGKLDHRGAQREFLAASEGETPLWKARAYAAEALLCLGDAAGARRLLDENVAGEKGIARMEALGWRGEVRLWMRDFEGALEDLKEAVAGNAPMARCWLGVAHFALGKLEPAISEFDAVLARFPRDGEASTTRGEALRMLGRYDEARRELERALKSAAEQGYPLWASLNLALLEGEAPARRLAELPEEIARRLSHATGLPLPKDSDSAAAAFARKALALHPGMRRGEPYLYPIWDPAGARAKPKAR